MKIENKFKKAFTLVELMTTIAIIGILAGVVLVSTQGSVDKSKKASAITTASSVLPELVTCADDGGFVKQTPVASEVICWEQAAFSSAASGHSAMWPDINAKTGWDYANDEGNTNEVTSGTYTFKITKTEQADIICDMAKNSCE